MRLSAAEFSIPDAEKFADEWLETNFALLGKAKVVSIALMFGCDSPEPLDYFRDGIRHIPSGAFSDAVAAFDKGASL